MKSNYKRIGDFIELVDIRNKGLKVTNLVGLSISKQFIKSVANTIGTDMENYKIIHKNEFACSIMQVRRDKKMPLALYKDDEPAIISQAYPVFKIREDAELQPEYLMMWFSRSEFDRHACFLAVGGVRGSLEWDDFLDMELPIPSIEKQLAIVKEYNTVVNRIKLNEQLNQKLEETAQALYKHWFVDFEFPTPPTSSPPREEEYPQGEVVKKIQQEVKLHQVVKPQHQDANNTHQVVKKTQQEVKPPQQDEKHPRQEAEITHPQQLNNLPYLKTFRKKLRNNLTPAEATLWTYLKGKQLENRKFRRQHSFGNYILDFYCPSESLAIELDGQGHFEAEQAEYDRERDLFLQYYGIKVLRFENKIVFENLHGLLEEVKQEFGWKMDHPAFQAPLLFQEGSTLGVGYKSSGGKMVFNEELDMEIPEGWERVEIKEFGKVITGKTPSSKFPTDFGDDFPFVTPGDFKIDKRFIQKTYRSLSKIGFDKLKTKSLRYADIIVTCIGSDMGKVAFAIDNSITNQQMNSIRVYKIEYSDYLYSYFKEYKTELKSIALGSSTMPMISKSEFEILKILKPDDSILLKFMEYCNPINTSLMAIYEQNDKLAELKNLLLSKMTKVESESYQIEKEVL